jgi:hypothetical protein
MEGAEPPEVLSGLGKGDVLADHLHNINPVPDLVDDLVSNQALPHSGTDSVWLSGLSD